MAPGLVVWDFDGTIADTRSVILNSFADVFAEHGLGPLDRDAVQALIGVPLADAFAEAVGTAEAVLVDRFVADYRRFFAARAPAEATMFVGIGELLASLADTATPAAIATSRGRASLEEMLDSFGIADHFTLVMASEDVTRHKPHPEMVEQILARTGQAAGDTLVIGDTTFDIAMGRDAGARTCAVTWGNQPADVLATARPDHIVDHPDELAALLG